MCSHISSSMEKRRGSGFEVHVILFVLYLNTTFIFVCVTFARQAVSTFYKNMYVYVFTAYDTIVKLNQDKAFQMFR